MRSSRISTSTSPVFILGLTVPSGRGETTPLAATTNSLRTFSALPWALGSRSGSRASCTRPVTVAQVDKDQAAVVAATLHPAHQADLVADMRGVEVGTVMCSLPVSQDVVQGNPLCLHPHREGARVFLVTFFSGRMLLVPPLQSARLYLPPVRSVKHAHAPPVSVAHTSSRAISRWEPSLMSRSMTTPRASSSPPRIATLRAANLSARRICALRLLPK